MISNEGNELRKEEYNKVEWSLDHHPRVSSFSLCKIDKYKVECLFFSTIFVVKNVFLFMLPSFECLIHEIESVLMASLIVIRS